MYVVRSYLPYDTLLNFDLVDNKLERNTVIKAKSAIGLNDIQHIDLPGTMKDVYNLTIQLKLVHFYLVLNLILKMYIISFKSTITILVRSLQHPLLLYL